VIIILDEIDLMNDDSVLMKLSRAEEGGKSTVASVSSRLATRSSTSTT